MVDQNFDKPLAVTVEKAGQMLGISRNLAYQLVKEGKIPTIKVGKRRLLVPLVELERLMKVESVE